MGNTANLLRNVIRNGGMPLTQVAERIETMYLNGRINAEEHMELTELMHNKADLSNETGDWKAMYAVLTEKYRALEARLTAAEKALGLYQEPEEGGGDTSYPVWEPWDGVGAGYQYGAIVMHGGKVWQNMLQGTANVWEPGTLGVDERYWKEVV